MKYHWRVLGINLVGNKINSCVMKTKKNIVKKGTM